MLKGYGSEWHSDNLRVRLLFVMYPGGDIRFIALVVATRRVRRDDDGDWFDMEGRPLRYLKGGTDIAKWGKPSKEKEGFAFRFKPGNR
jgi:hypothetical protein